LEKHKDRRFSLKIRKCLIFASIHPPHSLNQGQRSIFMFRECAESISRIKLPLETHFLQKFSKKFFFEERAPIVTPFKIFKHNTSPHQNSTLHIPKMMFIQ